MTLAEAGTRLGGRVARERALPGLAAWGRVADYRAGQIAPMPNVEVYFDSRLEAEDVLAMGAEHVAIATGAHWRRDVVARHHLAPIPTDPAMPVFTPDDLMDGGGPTGGRVLLYDDDHFYMGSVLAELLVARGCSVDFVTPAARVAEWTLNTLEQATIQRRLLEIGVTVRTSTAPLAIGGREVGLACCWTGAREPDRGRRGRDGDEPDRRGRALSRIDRARSPSGGDAGIASVKLIGDAAAPAPIAWATYAGRRYAEELDAVAPVDAVSFRREVASLAARD